MSEKRITVTYTLTEEQTKRMEKLTKAWNASNKTNSKSTLEELFEFMMIWASISIINEKLRIFEDYVARTKKQEE